MTGAGNRAPEVGALGVYEVPATKGGPSTTRRSRKKRVVDGDDCFFDLMSSWCDKTEACMTDISKKLGFDYDASAARKSVHEFLMKMSFLNAEDQISVAQKICNNVSYLDLFVSLQEEHKHVMASIYKNGDL